MRLAKILSRKKKFVIYAGKDRFPLPHDITAIAIYDFMDILKGKRE